MSVAGEPLRIDLTDRAWRLIDRETGRVQGDVDHVVAHMQALLRTSEVKTLCKYLGICSAGFLFYDYFRDMTRFFSEEGPTRSYSTPYLWSNEELHDRWSALVHWLFVKTRDAQQAEANRGELRTEDYFVHIPHALDVDRTVCDEERDARKDFALHYCTVGEMAYTITTWRLLTFAVALGRSGEAAAECKVSMGASVQTASPWTWLGLNSLDVSMGVEEANPFTTLLQDAWDTLGGRDSTWHQQWSLLGLSRDDLSSRSWYREPLCRFLRRLLPSDQQFLLNGSDDQLVSGLFLGIAPFLKRLGSHARVTTVQDCLVELEKRARFPIVPFYAWHILDGQPLAYLVCPVWTSQQYSVKTPSGDCRHLGLALCAVRPLLTLDWTVRRDDQMLDPAVSSVDPTVVTSVLKLMARPLVEGALYGTAIREVEAGHETHIKGAVQTALSSYHRPTRGS